MDLELRRELIDLLVREAYFERQVTLSSGKVSDYYLDCRPAMFLPRGMFLVGELMLEFVRTAGWRLPRFRSSARSSAPAIGTTSSCGGASYARKARRTACKSVLKARS